MSTYLMFSVDVDTALFRRMGCHLRDCGYPDISDWCPMNASEPDWNEEVSDCVDNIERMLKEMDNAKLACSDGSDEAVPSSG